MCIIIFAVRQVSQTFKIICPTLRKCIKYALTVKCCALENIGLEWQICMYILYLRFTISDAKMEKLLFIVANILGLHFAIFDAKIKNYCQCL